MAKKDSNIKKTLAKIIAILAEKKAENIVVLDVRGLSGICDYFIICSGQSAPQVKAIAQEVIKSGRDNQIKAQHFENDELSRWFLIDFFDVVVHVFLKEARDFYNLEHLWNKAKKIPLSSLRIKNSP